MNIREIISKYLKDNGFDGLIDLDYYCSCLLEDLMPCDCDHLAECFPAYKHKCEGLEKCKSENCEGTFNEKGIVEEGCMSVEKQQLEKAIEEGK